MDSPDSLDGMIESFIHYREQLRDQYKDNIRALQDTVDKVTAGLDEIRKKRSRQTSMILTLIALLSVILYFCGQIAHIFGLVQLEGYIFNVSAGTLASLFLFALLELAWQRRISRTQGLEYTGIELKRLITQAVQEMEINVKHQEQVIEEMRKSGAAYQEDIDSVFEGMERVQEVIEKFQPLNEEINNVSFG